ncbi:MAG: hypothetical protein BMS9Abin05_0537 [Rhodothermia bacterium]|nr:MAG: hypothetical protein BMS9Abin05_0537 [Rhodothermia bacterium]
MTRDGVNDVPAQAPGPIWALQSGRVRTLPLKLLILEFRRFRYTQPKRINVLLARQANSAANAIRIRFITGLNVR